jgi:hypothetical protein
MPGPEFFQTMMGRKFYEGDVPRIAKALEIIANNMEKQTQKPVMNELKTIYDCLDEFDKKIYPQIASSGLFDIGLFNDTFLAAKDKLQKIIENGGAG